MAAVENSEMTPDTTENDDKNGTTPNSENHGNGDEINNLENNEVQIAMDENSVKALTSVKPSGKIRAFFKKYFQEGQKLDEKHQNALESLPADASVWTKLVVKHRLLVGILIPLVFFQTLWWSLAIRHNYFTYFADRYLLTITMIFGSMIAGMTSEGGGAVAFPVMTLALDISPAVARDFSLMIQSCGQILGGHFYTVHLSISFRNGRSLFHYLLDANQD